MSANEEDVDSVANFDILNKFEIQDLARLDFQCFCCQQSFDSIDPSILELEQARDHCECNYWINTCKLYSNCSTNLPASEEESVLTVSLSSSIIGSVDEVSTESRIFLFA